MRQILLFSFFLLIISLTSCRKDFSFETSSGELRFSKDTVYLDTVFKNIGSSTYQLKVYNKSDKDISIPTIALEKGLSSKYRMIVDGMQGNNKVFKNVELLAKDSLFIFIETTADIVDANPNDFLYNDKILFGDGALQQKVELVTLIQDAFFIYPKKNNAIIETVPIGVSGTTTVVVNGRDLVNNHPDNGNEFVWRNTKPYVVYGYASVPNGQTLTVNAGARIHFHQDSGLIVQSNASIKINGTTSTTALRENEVIFEGDRLEEKYADVPGQWGLVYLRQGSKDNVIDNLTLKNAVVGLLITENLNATTIKNSQIYDCSNLGIFAQNTTIIGENLVVNAAGQAALACTLGGNYNFRHCAFNNNWNSTRQVSVLIDNFFKNASQQEVAFDLTQATFSNCIIYGGNQVQMLLNKTSVVGKQFNYKFNNCIIKFNNVGNAFANDALYDFNNAVLYSSCLISKNSSENNPKFKNVNKNQLNINETSAAFKKGNSLFLVNNDIIGKPRTSNPPDIGAYQSAPFAP
ncbi:MAG: hypothetical protein RLZZ312_1804 [Bacteroidota bacterium]|jgi:hypothetical protein